MEIEEINSEKLKATQSLVSNSNEVISFQLVDAVKNETFGDKWNPLFSHQVFEEENIYGFKDLTVEISVDMWTFYALVEIKCSEEESIGDIDALYEKIKSFLPEKHTYRDSKEFVEAVSKANDPLKSFSTTPLDEFNTKMGKFTIELVNIARLPEVQSLHERLEVFAFWMIDGAQQIDYEDNRWRLMLVNHINEDGTKTIIGYTTLIEFYNPTLARTCFFRICQVIVLPPYQRNGICAHMIETTYKYAKSMNADHVSVEDPSPAFTRVRDVVDCLYCRENKLMQLDEIPKRALLNVELTRARKESILTVSQLQRVFFLEQLKLQTEIMEDSGKPLRLLTKCLIWRKLKDSLDKDNDERTKKEFLADEFEKFMTQICPSLISLCKRDDISIPEFVHDYVEDLEESCDDEGVILWPNSPN
eukprot:TRINITY_DN2884_c0_g1_i1.p1 TRINITY_DN2884_c0_g1~~TRINITY_DN2884_c0_g1_i1.p1  ORF type:complete len:418 (-),score=85.88 TRINITY_DN2884_c0_g1_i1:134-1387(-)